MDAVSVLPDAPGAALLASIDAMVAEFASGPLPLGLGNPAQWAVIPYLQSVEEHHL